MVYQEQQNNTFLSSASEEQFDYSYVNQTARVAVYDDMKMAPRIIEVEPAPTQDFIEKLAAVVNEQRMNLGGNIPYAAIREVSENFIHARFSEMVVSIYDGGNTIRFSDQGPGIAQKEHALLPGFTNASNEMKHYIRGVGSGLPLVKDYLDYSQGHITIEDNMGTGAVVTISLNTKPAPSTHVHIPPLSPREQKALELFNTEGALGNKELAELLDIAVSSAHTVLTRLEEHGLIEKTSYRSKRMLTDYGAAAANQLAQNSTTNPNASN